LLKKQRCHLREKTFASAKRSNDYRRAETEKPIEDSSGNRKKKNKKTRGVVKAKNYDSITRGKKPEKAKRKDLRSSTEKLNGAKKQNGGETFTFKNGGLPECTGTV